MEIILGIKLIDKILHMLLMKSVSISPRVRYIEYHIEGGIRELSKFLRHYLGLRTERISKYKSALDSGRISPLLLKYLKLVNNE